MRIVHLDTDSLRPDHLGGFSYGRPSSPIIAEVAAQGMRFDRCYRID